MHPEVFERFRSIIYHKSGIVLSKEKQSLLASRIQKRLRARGLRNEAQYIEIIELDLDGTELNQLIDAISTNTTYFWREPEHFNILGEILEAWKAKKKSTFRLWCAASSSGQEPYTLAMEALEHLPPPQFNVKILATDVSTKVLRIAQAGVYTEADISKLPDNKRKRFFDKVYRNSEETLWQVSPMLSKLLVFKKLNLINFPYPLKGSLDVIFCRNAMIYFDITTRQKVIGEFHRLLAPGGFLFLSLSESLLGIENSFTKHRTSVYQKQE